MSALSRPNEKPPLAFRALRQITALLMLALIALTLLSLAFLLYQERYEGRIYRGVEIMGLDVGGLTPAQALDVLQREGGRSGAPYVSLHTAAQDWTVSAQQLGGAPDLAAAVRQGWLLGRSGAFAADALTQGRLLWWGYRVVPTFAVEPGPALIYLRPIAREAGHPARRAQLWVAGLQARVGEAVTGRDLDIAATRAAIERQVRAAWGSSAWHTTPRLLRELVPTAHSLSEEPIVVPLAFREVAPPLTEVAGARERASLILSRPLTLVATLEEFEADGRPRTVTRRWQVDQALMSSWLAVQSLAAAEGTAIGVEVDRAKIRAYLQTIAAEVERPPREGRFDYNPATNALTIHSPGQNGYTLDLDIAQALVAEACFAAQREVALPFIAIAPRVTRASLEAITPLTLISEGATSYRGSIPGRLQNIRLAASRFNGVIVPPQAAFSFLDALGLVTLANGYSEAWVILGDRTVLGPGGGVCLVSTTCFRAAFWAGLPILDRSPHSYRLPYYEPPIGLDAAVFSPIVDFKFQNNTDAPIIILTQMDEANEKLIFRFYSKPTGRKVTLDGPTTSNPVPAGAPIYEEDATLEPGAQVLVESPHDGIDAVLSRTVEQNGVVLYRDKFFSRYEPWPARYRIGVARR